MKIRIFLRGNLGMQICVKSIFGGLLRCDPKSHFLFVCNWVPDCFIKYKYQSKHLNGHSVPPPSRFSITRDLVFLYSVMVILLFLATFRISCNIWIWVGGGSKGLLLLNMATKNSSFSNLHPIFKQIFFLFAALYLTVVRLQTGHRVGESRRSKRFPVEKPL